MVGFINISRRWLSAKVDFLIVGHCPSLGPFLPLTARNPSFHIHKQRNFFILFFALPSAKTDDWLEKF